MTKRLRALLIGALLTFGLAACADNASESTTPPSPTAEASEPAESEAPASEPAESEAAASEERVRIDNSTFDPEELTIAAGTEVQWVNADSFGHTVTEGTDGQAVDDPIVDEEIAQNGTVSVTFEEPGTYDITCKIHPSMNMTITVEG